jgi:hypothetical protein
MAFYLSSGRLRLVSLQAEAGTFVQVSNSDGKAQQDRFRRGLSANRLYIQCTVHRNTARVTSFSFEHGWVLENRGHCIDRPGCDQVSSAQ